MKNIISELIQRFLDWLPVAAKAGLYLGLEALPILALAFLKFAKKEEVPSAWMLAYVCTNALYHGFIGLRAFFDNSSAQHGVKVDELRKARNGNTEFVTRQQAQTPPITPATPSKTA
jgi:hypothetical protein